MNYLQSVKAVLLTGIGYWVLGWSAGFFTIPPGYASPIWPAAGLALFMTVQFGFRALLGVLGASFLLNLGFSGASFGQPGSRWVVALLIASGAALQALVGFCLVKRFTRYPDLLSNHNDSILFAILGGPVACIASSTIGVISLVLNGVVSKIDVAENWLNWWVGDSIGVLALAPIFLVIHARLLWPSHTKVSSFIVLYLAMVAIASALFVQTRSSEESKTEQIFQEQVEGIHSTVLKQLDNVMHSAHTLTSLFSAFDDVSFDQFKLYSQGLYRHIPGSHALSWIPIVDGADRPQYESDMARYLREPYTFKEMDDRGEMVVAKHRSVYYPVYYITPFELNQRAAGFDLGSNQSRLSAIEKAISSKELISTEPIVLVQEHANEKAFLLLAPVVKKNRVVGLISCVYRAHDLIYAAVNEGALYNIAMTILDVTGANEEKLLFSNDIVGSDLVVRKSVLFSGRIWRLEYSAGADYIRQTQGASVWIVLISGFFIIAVLGVVVLLLMSQKFAVEKEVVCKTQALQDALDSAENASKVKSNFLASMSHELRTPLNSIIGFSVRSLKNLEGSGYERVMDSLGIVESNGRYLLSLINDILDLSKVEEGKMQLSKEKVVLKELATELECSLAPMAEKKGLILMVAEPPIKEIFADRKRLTQILINLLSNAIKFTNAGQIELRFELESQRDLEGIVLEVHDTGEGIDEKDIPKLFQRFEQLGETFMTGTIGSGLGLALVRELVELHNGDVSVKSEVKKGSVFSVWLPIW